MREFRELLDKHRPIVFAIVGGVLLVVFLVICWWVGRAVHQPGIQERVSQAYFYDLNTGELFTADAAESGPIETPSGPHHGQPAGVRAVVFSCGSCRIPEQRFVGWLEKPDPDFTAEESAEDDSTAHGEEPSGVLMRAVDGSKWVSLDSREADRIMAAVNARCGNSQTATFCHPPSTAAP